MLGVSTSYDPWILLNIPVSILTVNKKQSKFLKNNFKKVKEKFFEKEKEGEKSSENKLKANLIKEKIGKLYNLDAIKFHRTIHKFATGLIEKYGREKCLEYLFYHVLIGSTPQVNPENFPKNRIDFEGEESIENFVAELYKSSSTTIS